MGNASWNAISFHATTSTWNAVSSSGDCDPYSSWSSSAAPNAASTQCAAHPRLKGRAHGHYSSTSFTLGYALSTRHVTHARPTKSCGPKGESQDDAVDSMRNCFLFDLHSAFKALFDNERDVFFFRLWEFPISSESMYSRAGCKRVVDTHMNYT